MKASTVQATGGSWTPRMRGRRASSPRAAERDGAGVTAARCVGRGLGLGGTGTDQYLASSVAPSRPATAAASGSPLVRPPPG